MKDRKREKKKKKEQSYCRICGNNKGMIRRYGLNLCRRHFKEMAEKLGFKKLS